MRRWRSRFLRMTLTALVSFAALAGLWLGLLPQVLNPFPPLQLADSSPWFLDFRLAIVNRDRGACVDTIADPVIAAKPLVDFYEKGGCGWKNAVSIRTAGGAELSVAQVSCGVAAALAMWVQHEVQPLAEKHLGSRVTSISNMGTYSCRNIIGRKFFANVRSQHATANAIDVAGFKLADGRYISVARDWKGEAQKAAFLRAVHKRACAYFRVSLSPDFNAAHHDHFHFDRGYMSSCK